MGKYEMTEQASNKAPDNAPAYDVFLTAGCDTQPVLQDLAATYPPLADAALQQLVMQDRPGFLGLNLPETAAKTLKSRLVDAGARAEWIQAAYREPKISIERAAELAEPYIERRRQDHFPSYAFDPVRHWRQGDRPRWWGFFAPSPKLQDEGHIPGAIFASVDKLDGHVWTYEEQEQLARELGQLE